MKNLLQLSNADLSTAVNSFLRKSYGNVNLNVLGIAVENGQVSVETEILPRERKPRGPNKKTRAARHVTAAAAG